MQLARQIPKLIQQSGAVHSQYDLRQMILTPMYKNVSLGDVNKICFDDYAHTVHW